MKPLLVNRWKKWNLTVKIIPFLAVVVVLKLFFHALGWETLSLNPLFSSLVAGTIFLLGFLISGVLSDYKESEKIPGELAASIEVLDDEASILVKNKKSKLAREFRSSLIRFMDLLNQWLYKRERTNTMLKELSKMNDYFSEFESLTQAAFVSRMKQEQNAMRKAIVRIHTIRETSFVASAYAIVEVLAFFLILGLIFVKIEPFYESVFFVALVAFLILYMIFLIKDLDNPFEYSEHGETASEVSLRPLHDLHQRLKEANQKQ